MRKILFLLLTVILSQACTSTSENPIIEITSVTLNDSSLNYNSSAEAMPELKKGDELTIGLSLNGNGEELNTFIVHEENELEKQLDEIDIDLPDTGVSEDKNFTRPEEGIITFKNNVYQANLTLEAKVKDIKRDFLTLNLYLFSRSESEGDVKLIRFRTAQKKLSQQ